MRKILVVFFCVLVLAVSCSDSGNGGRTSLSLRIEERVGSRTIMPSQTLMDVQKYSISGSGPSGATFGPILSTNNELDIRDIAVGRWTVTARALNAQNNELAQGEGTIDIARGENSATIVLDEITGTGTLQLDFIWRSGICPEPQIRIVITIEDEKGNVVSRTKDVATSECSTSMVLNLPAGSHVLNIQVKDSTGNIGIGATDAVRIVSNTRSVGSVELNGSDVSVTDSSNALAIRFDNQVGPPMSFYMDYLPKNPSRGDFLTLYARHSTLPEGVSESSLRYQWYKDGVLMSPSSAGNLSMLAEAGTHRFDVIVRSNKEGTMCGASLILNISN